MQRHDGRERWVVSVREAAQLSSVSEITIRRLIAAGILPSVRVGRRVLVRVEDLKRLLEPNQEAHTVREVEQWVRSMRTR